MKKFFVYFVIIFFGIIMQVSSIPVFFGGSWLPDIVLSMILAWALIDGFEKFLPWAILAGILYDFLSFSIIGTNVIIFSLAAYSVGFFSKRFSTEMRGIGFALSIFFVFSATIGARMIGSFFWMAGEFSKKGFDGAFFMVGNFFWAFLWNMIFFFLFYYFINRIEDYFMLRRKTNIIVR